MILDDAIQDAGVIELEKPYYTQSGQREKYEATIDSPNTPCAGKCPDRSARWPDDVEH